MRKKYPLFIIDTSRTHNRGRDVDYLSCTSNECPFTAIVEFVEMDAIPEEEKKNPLVAHSEYNNGRRVRISILTPIAEKKYKDAKSLLSRAMKELLQRRQAERVDVSNITNSNIVWLIEHLIEQNKENRRLYPDDVTHKTIGAILQAIKDDYAED